MYASTAVALDPPKNQAVRAVGSEDRLRMVCYWTNSGQLSVLARDGSVVNGPQDQGVSKPFDFITDNDVGDVINDAKAFAAWI